MDDKLNPNNKPLRNTFNTLKDLKNTYLKNQDKKVMVAMEHEKDLQEQELEEKVDNAFKNSNLELELEQGEVHQAISEADTENLNKEIEELEFKVDSLEQEVENLKDQILRKTAEMENQRRRFMKEKIELLEVGNEKLLMKFLEIPDDMSKALDAAKKTEDKSSVVTGIEMIHNKVNKIFEDAGVIKMSDPIGSDFNVNIQEAISITPSTEFAEGKVVYLVQDGYMIGDKVLRFAKVITSAGSGE